MKKNVNMCMIRHCCDVLHLFMYCVFSSVCLWVCVSVCLSVSLFVNAITLEDSNRLKYLHDFLWERDIVKSSGEFENGAFRYTAARVSDVATKMYVFSFISAVIVCFQGEYNTCVHLMMMCFEKV